MRPLTEEETKILFEKLSKYIGENNYEHGSVERTGILLTNLGTPDEPNSKAVKIYLAEFLSDTRVIEFPKFIWKIILHGIILRIRPKRSAKTYKTIWTDEGSPLLNIAKKQIELVSSEDVKKSNIFSRILTSLNYLVWGDV